MYDGFVAMREELEAEKAAMSRIWKKREAQLTRMQDGLLSVVGICRGSGGGGAGAGGGGGVAGRTRHGTGNSSERASDWR